MEQRMRTWAEISLSNIEFNVKSIKAALPHGCKFLGVLKANAYGHGAVPCAGAMLRAGADYLAVACLSEAQELRAGGIESPILIFGVTPPQLAPELQRLSLTQTVGSLDYARELNDKLEKPILAHLKLDTGMGRLGFGMTAAELAEAAEAVSFEKLDFEGIFTHFAVSDVCGDDFTKTQFERFTKAAEHIEGASGHRFELHHCANSGAVINYKRFALSMVRPGLISYGMYPDRERGEIELRPALALKTRISSINEHVPGDTIGYGRAFMVKVPMKIAVLPIGYADGLHRCASGRLRVLINGQFCPQVGRICMDMCMVDVSNLPSARCGDIATLIGSDGENEILADEIAKCAETINYEIPCAITARVPRVYG